MRLIITLLILEICLNKMNDQTIVKIEVNGKLYPISCKIGEEDRVIDSGKLLSEIISTLDNQDNKISESCDNGYPITLKENSISDLFMKISKNIDDKIISIKKK